MRPWLYGQGQRLFPVVGWAERGDGRAEGHDHSWFILTRRIIEKEFALSGSEQNPDLTGRSIRQVLGRIRPGAPGPVQAFVDHGADFTTATTITQLVASMNDIAGEDLLDAAAVADTVAARDRQVMNAFSKDTQLVAIRGARGYRAIG